MKSPGHCRPLLFRARLWVFSSAATPFLLIHHSQSENMSSSLSVSSSFTFCRPPWSSFRACLEVSGKESACQAGDASSITGSGRSPGEEMETSSSILTRKTPPIEKPGGGVCAEKRSPTVYSLRLIEYLNTTGSIYLEIKMQITKQ